MTELYTEYTHKVCMPFVHTVIKTSVNLNMQVGWEGYLNTNEKYFYCLDALPIFTAFCVYSIFHFGYYMDESSAV